MAIQDKTTLKTFFETNDVPTESNFIDLIDSFSDFSLTSLVSANSATWEQGVDLTEVAAASGDWDSTYSTSVANSASWSEGVSGAFFQDGQYAAYRGDVVVGPNNNYGVMSIGTAVSSTDSVGGLIFGNDVTAAGPGFNKGVIVGGDQVTARATLTTGNRLLGVFALGTGITCENEQLIGNASIGVGINNHSPHSFIIGEFSTSTSLTGEGIIIAGNSNTVEGSTGVFAAGSVNTVLGSVGQMSIGRGNTSIGDYGIVAIGPLNTCMGDEGYGVMTLGTRHTAMGNYGVFMIGEACESAGSYGVIVGGSDSNQLTEGEVDGVIALGRDASAVGARGLVSVGALPLVSGDDGVIAIGNSTTAIGSSGIMAFGSSADIRDASCGALAFGINITTLSTGSSGSIAFGSNTTCYGGTGTIVGGSSNTALSGCGVIVLGNNCENIGSYGSLAIGNEATTHAGYGSFGMGFNSTAVGDYACWAIGTGSTALGSATIAFGSAATTLESNCYQFGAGYNDEPNSLQIAAGIRLLNQPPSSPKDGDIWIASNNVYIRSGGTTRDMSTVSA